MGFSIELNFPNSKYLPFGLGKCAENERILVLNAIIKAYVYNQILSVTEQVPEFKTFYSAKSEYKKVIIKCRESGITFAELKEMATRITAENTPSREGALKKIEAKEAKEEAEKKKASQSADKGDEKKKPDIKSKEHMQVEFEATLAAYARAVSAVRNLSDKNEVFKDIYNQAIGFSYPLYGVAKKGGAKKHSEWLGAVKFFKKNAEVIGKNKEAIIRSLVLLGVKEEKTFVKLGLNVKPNR